MSLRQTLSWISGHPLSRQRPLRNLDRFVSWQVQSRLPTRARDFGFVNGSRLLIEPGMTGATGNYYVGLHEFSDMGFALHFLRPSDHFVDVGANVGSFTVLAGAAIGADVTAFEPAPETFNWLCRNVQSNGIGARTKLVCSAVGSKAGKVRFTSTLGPMNHISEQGDVEVPIDTLDGALDRPPALLKIDAEGHELEIIRGAKRWLASADLKCIIGEIYHGSDAEAALLGAGFKRKHYDPLARSYSQSLPGDQIFIRDEDYVVGRTTTAPPFVVQGSKI